MGSSPYTAAAIEMNGPIHKGQWRFVHERRDIPKCIRRTAGKFSLSTTGFCENVLQGTGAHSQASSEWPRRGVSGVGIKVVSDFLHVVYDELVQVTSAKVAVVVGAV